MPEILTADQLEEKVKRDREARFKNGWGRWRYQAKAVPKSLHLNDGSGYWIDLDSNKARYGRASAFEIIAHMVGKAMHNPDGSSGGILTAEDLGNLVLALDDLYYLESAFHGAWGERRGR